MKKNRRGSHVSFLGYVSFFLLVAFILTVAVLSYSYIKDSVSESGTIAAIMLVLVVVLAAICTAIDYLRRKIMVDKPVNKILEATDKITDGDFNINLKPAHRYDKYDAYDLIMENINKMAKELSRNEVLKTDFVSNVSHEIKTPLAIIANYATLLQDENLTSEQRSAYTADILRATRRLTDLVTDILKLNKLENQVIREQKAEMNLSDFVGEIVLGFEDALDRKNIDLTCDIDDVTTLADKTFIEIICNNLMSNAVKFTPKGGKIVVSLKRVDDEVCLSVADSGCGMDADTGAHIFDKFYQGDTSHSEEGNGLGLALVKKVIDNMGGTIFVESELGKGSVFIVKWKI